MIGREQLVDSLQSGRPLIVGRGSLPTADQVADDPDGDFVVEARLLREVLLEVVHGKVSAVDPQGLRLMGAAVIGTLDLASMKIPHGLGFFDCLFDEPVEMLETVVDGWFRMPGCHVLGTGGQGWSLFAKDLRVAGSLHLNAGFSAAGAVVLSDVQVAGALRMNTAHIGGSDVNGWSLDFQRSKVGSSLLADDLVTSGAVSLSAASIGNQLSLRGAQIGQAESWSLIAQNMRVSFNVYLDRGFEPAGAVSLNGAQISGQLGMVGAKLRGHSPEGWSLDAQDLRVDLGAYFRGGFESAGGLNLDGTDIGGQLSMVGARVGLMKSGYSIDGRHLRVGHDAILGAADQFAGPLRLVGGRFNRLVLPVDAEPPVVGNVAGWQVGDLIGRPRTDRTCAAQWLEGQSTAQPWLEIASFYDRIGQPSDARWMRYRSAVRTTGHGSRWSKPGRWLYRITTGHGYYAAPLTLGWLLAIFLTAWTLTASHPDDFTTATTATIRQDIVDQQQAAGVASPPPVPGRVPASAWNDAWDTPEFQPWTYALSTAVPTTSSATSQPWTPRAGWLSAVLAVLRALSWIFTALFLAGITGLLRKQT